MGYISYGVGSNLIRFVEYLGGMFFFFMRSLASIVSPPSVVHETIKQIYMVGVKSLPLTTVAALSVGIVLAMQSIGVLGKFGIVNYVALLVGQGMVRELGPVLTALMVAGRAGSGISAEIGSMAVTRQIDALRVSAVNPMKYLVITRILACMIVLPFLTLVADVVGMIGGLVIGTTQAAITPSYYITVTVNFVLLEDIVPGLLKTIIFGMIIGTVACYHGFQTKGGTEGVGISTTTTVVVTSLMILISDVILTRLLLFVM